MAIRRFASRYFFRLSQEGKIENFVSIFKYPASHSLTNFYKFNQIYQKLQVENSKLVEKFMKSVIFDLSCKSSALHKC